MRNDLPIKKEYVKKYEEKKKKPVSVNKQYEDALKRKLARNANRYSR